MEYTLGLDIGIASVGWAVLSNDAKGEPCHIEDLGVRIFEAAEQPKTGASLLRPVEKPEMPDGVSAAGGIEKSVLKHF